MATLRDKKAKTAHNILMSAFKGEYDGAGTVAWDRPDTYNLTSTQLREVVQVLMSQGYLGEKDLSRWGKQGTYLRVYATDKLRNQGVPSLVTKYSIQI